MDQHSGTTSGHRPFSSYFAAIVVIAVAIPSVAQNPGDLAALPPNRLVVVSIPDRKLAIVESDIVKATFPVAVGAATTPSPTGEFLIVNRVANPTYYRPGMVIPSGKDNPVGTRWVGLSLKGYGIHGTNAPRSVGTAASHGCIRLRNRDMERLFAMVRIGDRVVILGERDERAARYFGTAPEQQIVASAQGATASGGQ
jgi:lipoprotein-anchoring transpeptidase ErfK/SrfK